MLIFINYSHEDSDFVLNQIRFFVDRSEMNVGDSITEKVSTAISIVS